MTRGRSQWILVLLLLGSLALLVAAPARAHIQVLPSEVAPADSDLFTVLVPGETSSGTTRVELKVPPDVYPFSFEETPGWQRELIEKPNGLIDRVVWTGKAKPDGMVRFNFLAGTPEQPGSIRWAAIQTYANGQQARWIGPAGSENPAATTTVSASASRANAGGEGGQGAGKVEVASDSESGQADEGTNWPLTIAALLGFFFGLSSLVILFLNQRGPASPEQPVFPLPQRSPWGSGKHRG